LQDNEASKVTRQKRISKGCQIKEAGLIPALPRNCKRNEIHVDPLTHWRWEGVESRSPQARKLYGEPNLLNPEGEGEAP
jgi:hypothetical protein